MVDSFIFSTYHCVSKDYVQRYIDEQTYRFEDMFKKAVKHFEYADVLSLSSVVSIEHFYAQRAKYHQMWKEQHCA